MSDRTQKKQRVTCQTNTNPVCRRRRGPRVKICNRIRSQVGLPLFTPFYCVAPNCTVGRCQTVEAQYAMIVPLSIVRSHVKGISGIANAVNKSFKFALNFLEAWPRCVGRRVSHGMRDVFVHFHLRPQESVEFPILIPFSVLVTDDNAPKLNNPNALCFSETSCLLIIQRGPRKKQAYNPTHLQIIQKHGDVTPRCRPVRGICAGAARLFKCQSLQKSRNIVVSQVMNFRWCYRWHPWQCQCCVLH